MHIAGPEGRRQRPERTRAEVEEAAPVLLIYSHFSPNSSAHPISPALNTIHREVLRGGEHSSAKRDAVTLNAGVGLYVYGSAGSIAEGVQQAREALNSGRGLEKLDQWIETTQAVWTSTPSAE